MTALRFGDLAAHQLINGLQYDSGVQYKTLYGVYTAKNAPAVTFIPWNNAQGCIGGQTHDLRAMFRAANDALCATGPKITQITSRIVLHDWRADSNHLEGLRAGLNAIANHFWGEMHVRHYAEHELRKIADLQNQDAAVRRVPVTLPKVGTTDASRAFADAEIALLEATQAEGTQVAPIAHAIPITYAVAPWLDQKAAEMRAANDNEPQLPQRNTQSPLERMFERGQLDGDKGINEILYLSGRRYYQDWYLSGLGGISGIDYSRTQGGGDPAPTGGMPSSMKQAYHRAKYREARHALGDRYAQIVEPIVCEERSVTDVAGAVEIAHNNAARAVAKERLNVGLRRLAVHYGSMRVPFGGVGT